LVADRRIVHDRTRAALWIGSSGPFDTKLASNHNSCNLALLA
jgi:hypothetical protein